MEKFGVACGCAQGKPKSEDLIKQGDGSHNCGVCGRNYQLDPLKLSDTLHLTDEQKTPQKKK